MQQRRQLFSHDKLENIYNSALKVLNDMGMRVENRQCLEAMEAFGAKIDWPKERALMSPELINRMLDIVRSDDSSNPGQNPIWHPEYSVGGGGTCPFIFDDATGSSRRANEADCIHALKILETSPAVVCEVPVSNSDCAPMFEAVRINQLGIETLNKTVLAGTDLFSPEQVPFMVEMGELYKNDPAWFLPIGNCPNSPLEISKVIADLALAKAPYNIPYAVPTMPVMGANAPITPAGCAVIGVAEILGGYVLAKSLNPETKVRATALSSIMNMRTAKMDYVSPEVFRADIATMEVLEIYLGLPCCVHGLYIDSKVPGQTAIKEKLLRCLGLGLFGNLTGMHGTLDQGRVFSATQMMLDYDMHEFLSAYTSVSDFDDSMGVDAILEIEWNTSEYMMHEHTLEHMKDIWNSSMNILDAYGADTNSKLLASAREIWEDNLAKYEPPNHSDDFLRSLRDISKRAEKALS